MEQLAELASWAAIGAFYTYEDARQWVAEMWQVHYSYDGIRSLLNRIGIYPRVPRPVAAQADQEAQVAWQKGGSVKRSGHILRTGRPKSAGVTSSASDWQAPSGAC